MAVDFLKEHLEAAERKAAEEATVVEEDWIVEFDLNLGHIATLILFIATLCFSYMALDKKITALEETTNSSKDTSP